MLPFRPRKAMFSPFAARRLEIYPAQRRSRFALERVGGLACLVPLVGLLQEIPGAVNNDVCRKIVAFWEIHYAVLANLGSVRASSPGFIEREFPT